MRSLIIGAICSVTGCLQVFSQNDKIDKYIREEMRQNHIPGISFAVVSKGTVVFAREYGMANVELSIPVNSRSVFQIASVTKPITAIAVLQLEEDGKVSLDSSLNHYLSDLPIQWSKATIRQALSHTSGIPNYFQSPDWSWRNSWHLDLTQQEVIKMTAAAPMSFVPGMGMKYSNTGYYLLGMLIEKVSGASYAQYIGEHIFKPLRMNCTCRCSGDSIVPNRVTGYTFTNGKLTNAEHTSDTWAYSEGGILTTALDLAKLDSALCAGKLLRSSTIEKMWTPSYLNNGEKGVLVNNSTGEPNYSESNYYGLGWFISSYKNRKVVSHGGHKPGFTSIYFRLVDDNLSIIILSNLSDSPLYTIARHIAEMYLSK